MQVHHAGMRPGLERALARPRAEQKAALDELRSGLPPIDHDEEWNTAFGASSLYDAFTRLEMTRDLHAANRALIRAHLDGIEGDFVAIEIGGGNGCLWQGLLGPEDRGRLLLVDPVEAAHDEVRGRLPAAVRLESRLTTIEESCDLPDADIVVVSLTLHHVAGRDRHERARHGLAGIGKLEVLSAVANALRARGGLAIVNEADVYCDIGLPPGDPVLANNVIDSYLRRTARAVLVEIDGSDVDPELRRRWLAIVRRWCLDQLEVIDRPLAERDVFELTVVQWLELFAAARLRVIARRFTDRHCLFHQYVLAPEAVT